jgi:ABC-type multidrug transport system permease subunit
LEKYFSLFSSAVPTERSTILKENFNRWYTVKAYFLSTMIIDLPISTVSSFLFSLIIYLLTGWPLELQRFMVFFVISLLIVLVSQTVGLIIGSCFNVIVSSFSTLINLLPGAQQP